MITLGELNRRHGIGKRKANRLIELGKLELVSRSTERPLRTYITKESVELFVNEKADFEKKFILCKDVFKILGISNLIFYNYLENREQLNANFNQEVNFFEIHELHENYYGIADQRHFFNRKDLEILLQDYLTLEEAQELVGQKDNSGFSSWLQRRPQIQVFCFAEKPRNARFVRKSTLLEVHRTWKPKRPGPQYDKEMYLTYTETQNTLQLSDRYFENLIKEKTLVPSKNIGRALFFEIEQVNYLVQQQELEYTRLSKDYMTYPQILIKYPDLNPNKLSVTKRIRKIELPALLSTIFKERNDHSSLGKYLYLKEDVNEYHNFVSVLNATHLEANYQDPFSEYNRRLQINNLVFSDKNKITEQLWNEYASEFIHSRQSRAYDVTGEIWCLIRVAEALTQMLDKEIYEYSAKELNLLFLNNLQIVRKAREELYQFLIFIDKLFLLRYSKSPFQLEVLINPRKLQRESREKKVYSYFEYEAFFNFVTNLDIHKKSAVSEAITLAEKKNSKKYSGYDSMWLYMLIHLNNTWRHSDCQLVPRISLEGTEIKNLQWLFDNDLSDADVKKIIFRLKCTPMIVSKTQVERNFFCASEVERPLATALAICELRTSAFNEDSFTIISGISNVNGKLLRSRALNAFFKDYQYKDTFTFSNRAMNRTVYSLVQCVQAFYANDKDTEYLRILRSHANIETTDIYNLIPQERMDVIALQLFDRDMFGHIPDTISNLLFGHPGTEIVQTKRIKDVKDNLGSIYKLEETAGFINNLKDYNIQASRAFIEQHIEYKDIIEKLMKEMSSEEVHSLYYKIVTHQLPSKEQHVQCIVSESQCKFPGRDCGGCPLSIPQFYAISSLVERIFIKIQSIENAILEQLPEAELTRMANWLELDLDLLKYAQKKYGKQEVAMFATGINKRLQKIGFLRAYQTIKLTEVNS